MEKKNNTKHKISHLSGVGDAVGVGVNVDVDVDVSAGVCVSVGVLDIAVPVGV